MNRNQRCIRSIAYRDRTMQEEMLTGWVGRKDLKGLKCHMQSLFICISLGMDLQESSMPPVPVSPDFWFLMHCAMKRIEELCKAKHRKGSVTCLAVRKKYLPGRASVVFWLHQSLYLWGRASGMRDEISYVKRKRKISSNVRNWRKISFPLMWRKPECGQLGPAYQCCRKGNFIPFASGTASLICPMLPRSCWGRTSTPLPPRS